MKDLGEMNKDEKLEWYREVLESLEMLILSLYCFSNQEMANKALSRLDNLGYKR